MKSLQLLSILCLLSGRVLLQAQPSYSPPPPARENITAIEWFIDQDPGFGQGHLLSPAPMIDLAGLIAAISLTDTRPGVHRLFLRSRDNAGNWSFTSGVTFENLQPTYTPPPPPAPDIAGLEIFFDKDPGSGNGFRQVIPGGADIHDLDLSPGIDTLAPGTHRLFARSLSTAWSLTAVATFRNDVILPLTWLYVKGELAGDQSVITWGTAEEHNTARFGIEHSIDGISYKTIGTLPAAGNSTTARDYRWIDVTPAPGLNYYRIRQTDADGKFTWSAIVTVVFRGERIRTIASPNPTRDKVILTFPSPSVKASLYVYNAAGQLVLTSAIDQGAWQKELDLGRFASGIYTIIIIDKETSAHTKVSLLKY